MDGQESSVVGRSLLLVWTVGELGAVELEKELLEACVVYEVDLREHQWIEFENE